MQKSFKVVDSSQHKIIKFNPISDFSWRVVTQQHKSTSIQYMTNEEVKKSYDYFSSHWMDYDLQYI